MSLGILHIMAMWEAKEISMMRGREREKKTVFLERCRFLSVVLSLSVPHFWILRYREIVHWWEPWKRAWRTLSPARKKTHKKLPVSFLTGLSYQCSSHSKSVKYQIRAVLPKVSWIEAPVFMFGDLWATARAVSPCKTCNTITGGHCQAGLSQRVLCFVDRNSSTASECTYSLVNKRHTVILCFMSLAAEIWREAHFWASEMF